MKKFIKHMGFQISEKTSLNTTFKEASNKIILSSFTYLFFLSANSQTIGRSQISSLGTTNCSSGITLQSAVGQSALTTFENTISIILGQGFLQPLNAMKPKRELEVNVYPNPSNGTFYLESISNDPDLILYQLFDSYGNLIHSSEYKPNSVANIQICSLITGIYILKIIQNNTQLTKKISILN